MSAVEGPLVRWQVRRTLDPLLGIDEDVTQVPGGANPVEFALAQAESDASEVEAETAGGVWKITQPGPRLVLLTWTWPNGITGPQTDRYVIEVPALSCPTAPFTRDGETHTVVGCGSTRVERDTVEENLWDCLDCGIWFDPSREAGQ